MGKTKTESWRGQIRLPMPIAEWLQARAANNYRTTNAEIVELLRRAKEHDATALQKTVGED